MHSASNFLAAQRVFRSTPVVVGLHLQRLQGPDLGVQGPPLSAAAHSRQCWLTCRPGHFSAGSLGQMTND